MKKVEEKKKSGAPMLIIGGVLVAVLVIGWYMIGSAKTTVNSNANRAANTANAAKTPAVPLNVPAGATPPNLAGSPTALVTVEEFADFQCGSCAAAHPTMNEIKSMYGSRIKFIFRNYPLAIPQHAKSYDAAVAAEAAGLQGKFWDMQNQLFTNQQAWTANPNYKQIWNEYAQKIGLDMSRFASDTAGIAAKGRVDADIARGKGLNVNSTPTVYINGVSVPYTEMKVDSLKTIIDAELAKGTAPATVAPTANTSK